MTFWQGRGVWVGGNKFGKLGGWGDGGQFFRKKSNFLKLSNLARKLEIFKKNIFLGSGRANASTAHTI